MGFKLQTGVTSFICKRFSRPVPNYNATYFPVIFAELVPYFTQMPSSYIAYRGLRSAHRQFEITLSFKPESSEGKHFDQMTSYTICPSFQYNHKV